MNERNDEEQNRRLAELIPWEAMESGDGFWHVENKQTGEKRGHCAYMGLNKDHAERVFFPKFCTDLNETAKVEATLTEAQREEYINRYLLFYSGAETREQGPIDLAKLAMASAKQRTEALIATLTP